MKTLITISLREHNLVPSQLILQNSYNCLSLLSFVVKILLKFLDLDCVIHISTKFE